MRKAVVLVVLLCACSSGKGATKADAPVASEPATTTSDPHVAPPAAVDACHAAVKDRLTLPETVVFSEPEVVRNDRLKTQLKGTATIGNALGGQVTIDWTCDAATAGGTEYQAVVDVTARP